MNGCLDLFGCDRPIELKILDVIQDNNEILEAMIWHQWKRRTPTKS